MNPTLQRLRRAASDLRWLLSRGYPREASLTLVGNRYDLPKEWREVLRRGVMVPEVAERRRQKLIGPEGLQGEDVALDGYNVLITLESALKGKVVLEADDGLVRDISGVSGGFRPGGSTEEAVDLILGSLKEWGVRRVLVLLDSPISRSGELASWLRLKMAKRGLEGEARAVPVPEREILGFGGVVCSSDGEVVDRAERVFDLAGFIIRERLRVPLIDLKGDEGGDLR